MFSVSWQWDFRGAYPETLSTGTLQEFGPADSRCHSEILGWTASKWETNQRGLSESPDFSVTYNFSLPGKSMGLPLPIIHGGKAYRETFSLYDCIWGK